MFGIFRRKLKLIVFVILILFLGFFIFRSKLLPKAPYNQNSKTTVKRGNIENKLTISGEIDAEEKATLRFATSGRMVWVGVKEGDYVKKYQSIASLDKRELEKDLKKKLLNFMNERWDFEQAQDDKSVHGRKRIDVPGLTDAERRILDKAQFDLDSTVVDVEIQNLALEYSNLWTPIEGIVTKVTSPYAGVNITPAGAEFEIVNPETVYFNATADETEVTQLKEGESGKLVLDAYPDQELDGSIKFIAFKPKSDETGTVYQVKLLFNQPNADFKYRLGMVGDLTFVTESINNALFLPPKFILAENGKKFLFVKKDQTIEKLQIKTGMETDDRIEILSGVEEKVQVYQPQS